MKLDSLSYFEICIIPFPRKPFSDEQRAAVSDFFCACGIPRYQIVLMEGPEQVAAATYTRSLKKRKQIKARFRKTFPKGMRLKERLLVKEDWFDKWQADYGIMPVGKKFVLVPEWKRKDYKPGKRTPIFLDPMGVSGSGQHPTTQIMIDMLETLDGKFKTCLDLGAGTGILGIAAGKLGAESVLATDIDRRAVKAARVNFKLNKTPRAVSIYEDVTRHRIPKKYDLVCANLISPVLEVIRKFLFSSVSSGGYLAVSGIHVLNFPGFKPKFRDPRFRCLKVIQRRGWTALLFKKTR